MSHPQSHCMISFILRHAWLNLWDKHMTTGRINQVTTFRPCIPEDTTHDSNDNQVAFSFGSSFKWSRLNCNLRTCSASLRNNDSEANSQATLFPDLTNFRHISLFHLSDRDHGLQRELPTAGLITKDVAQPWRIPKWLNATGLAISK